MQIALEQVGLEQGNAAGRNCVCQADSHPTLTINARGQLLILHVADGNASIQIGFLGVR